MFQISTIALPQEGGLRRESPRHRAGWQSNYAGRFDWFTVFYDLFLLEENDRLTLICVGPPLRNLAAAFTNGSIDRRRVYTFPARYYFRDRCCDVWFPGWESPQFSLNVNGASCRVMPQFADTETYRDKRVLLTISHNNEIDWIVDWARFHAVNHGADALLLYDNQSTRYSPETLEVDLRKSLPNMTVNVVDWNVPFGPVGDDLRQEWDSDYGHYGFLQHARFRFLSTASSVLSIDVDELVLKPAGESAFSLAERSIEGYVHFNSRWVTNAVSDERREQLEARVPRHSDFQYLRRGEGDGRPPKWCVVPAACKITDQWRVHEVDGKPPCHLEADELTYRHFYSVSTSWNNQRSGLESVDPERHDLDQLLADMMSEAGI